VLDSTMPSSCGTVGPASESGVLKLQSLRGRSLSSFLRGLRGGTHRLSRSIAYLQHLPKTRRFIASLRGHVAAVYRVSWSADSRMLVSASKDSTLKVGRIITFQHGVFHPVAS
jgi:WD40 repeat protein